MTTKQNARVPDHQSCHFAVLDLQIDLAALDLPIPRNQIPGSPIPKRNPNRKQNIIPITLRWMVSFVCLLLLTLHISSPCIAQIENSSLRFDTTVVNNHSDCAFIIELNDTTIQTFEVALSTTRDTIDIFLHEILFDPTSGLPQDFTYQRNGHLITLGVGNRERLGYYYGQVRAKNSLGVWSEPYRFLQN